MKIMETSPVSQHENPVHSPVISDINRNIDTDKLSRNKPENSCVECNLKFDSSSSLEVHLQYHNKNLYTRWALETSVSAPPPPPPPGLTTVTCVSVGVSVESPVSVSSTGTVSSGHTPAGHPAHPASSMQISMAQSMGIQQGAPPHLATVTHHTSPIFNSSAQSGQSAGSPGLSQPPTPSTHLPSINTDVSEFFSQLETVSGGPGSETGSLPAISLDSFHNSATNGAVTGPAVGAAGGVSENKNNRFHPYGAGDRRQAQNNYTSSGGQGSAMSHQGSTSSPSVSQYQSYSSPFHDNTFSHSSAGPASAGSGDYLAAFSETHPHDQSSEEIWDLDSHTVRRYNPGPDPVSPGPIPTTPTMYGVNGAGNGQVGTKSWQTDSAGLYSPYGSMARVPPQSLSPGPGLGQGWPGMGMKGGTGAPGVPSGVPAGDSKRPKSYQCEACDKNAKKFENPSIQMKCGRGEAGLSSS